MDLGRHANPPPAGIEQKTKESATRRSAGHRPFATVRQWLPRGNTLDSETFAQRHRLLCWLLALHIPALVAFGLWQRLDPDEVVVALLAPTVFLLLGRWLPAGRLAAFFVTAGLVFCSSVLVHFSGGTIEAHFHFFVLIGFISLYQDWVPLLWNTMFVVLSHGIGSGMAPDTMYNHPAAQNSPWLWAGIHGTAVLAASVGVILYWRHTELLQERNLALSTQLAEAEVATVQTEADRRKSISSLLVHLARRNQSLLDRQLGLIGELEQQERAPETLAELFKLDHLATRMRRNAESLLVLSGEDTPRRWGRPVPLVEVVRAAAAEVEDYERVDVLLSDHLEVEGRVVADLAHLLAELIENATIFSAPTSEVRVNSYPLPGEPSSHVLSIEDMGIGMSESDLRQANQVLAEAPEVDLRWSTLGFHVVSRLAGRYGLGVRVASTPGGGVTALVTLPPDLVGERALTAGAFVEGPPAELGPAPESRVLPQDRWTAADPEAVARMMLPATQEGDPGYQGDPERETLAPPWVSPLTVDPETDPSQSAPGAVPWPKSLPLLPADPSIPAEPRPPIESLPPVEPLPMPPVEPRSLPEPPSQDATEDDGLDRRVPGERLAPALRWPSSFSIGNRSDSEPDSPTPGGEAGWAGWDGQEDQAPGGLRDRDELEHIRSMLSRFQASQRAGRAVAEGPRGEAFLDDEFVNNGGPFSGGGEPVDDHRPVGSDEIAGSPMDSSQSDREDRSEPDDG